MFTRPAYVKPASPVSKIMDDMEAAATAGNLAIVEKHYAYFMMNMGNMGAAGRREDGDIAEYLEQFDAVFA